MFGGRPIQTDDIALLLVSLPFWGIVICGVRALRSMHPLYKQYGKYTPFYLHEGRFIINKMRMWSLRPQLFLARHIAFPVTAIDRVLIGCASDGDRYSMSVRVRTKDGRVSPIYWFSPGVYSPPKCCTHRKPTSKSPCTAPPRSSRPCTSPARRQRKRNGARSCGSAVPR